jgi:hypothetical protein
VEIYRPCATAVLGAITPQQFAAKIREVEEWAFKLGIQEGQHLARHDAFCAVQVDPVFLK